MRDKTRCLIWILALIFAGLGLYGLFRNWNEETGTLVGCCLIVVSLVFIVFLVYQEIKGRELQSHRDKLLSLLKDNEQKIEDYRSKYSECVEAILNEFGTHTKDNIDVFVALVEKKCSGNKRILEKLLEEREEVVRTLVREKVSDSDSC